MKQEFSIPSLAARIASEADTYKLLEQLRWPAGMPDGCPHCGGAEKFYSLPRKTAATPGRLAPEVTDPKRTHLHTDSAMAYRQMAPDFAAHEYVNHSAGEYVRGNVSTNLNEGYFSQLKRSLDGTHHHVSVEHLQRYLHQFDWLYTHCHATDSQRLRLLLGNVGGRRLTYRPLIRAVSLPPFKQYAGLITWLTRPFYNIGRAAISP
ncbi:MAG TPA: IS1595 family transposase [Jatrophihabitans sp.]|nr:IS1595 family transposase [Jatrophihabitans sp.]